jgi:hypothetical protein
MALIDCPECGHRVSDVAETCPWCGVRLSGQTAQLQLQLELSQIELEWERDRHRYMARTKYGQEYVPKKGGAAVVALLSLVGGAGCGIWIDSQVPGSAVGVFFAAFIMVVGLGVGLWSYLKAEAYEEAHAAYLKKKEAARLKYEGQAEGQT